MKKCLCGSGESYPECCGRFHRGERPETPVEVMRSRYVAYARGLADYILETQTQPTEREGVLRFSRETHFQRLEVVEVEAGEEEGFVTFIAHLKQGGQDASFKERSRFRKIDGRWLYVDGVISH